jgi:hypothetical protein
MRRKLFLATAAAALVAAAMLTVGSAQDAAPTSGAVIASDLSATGAAIGPDGALYVPTGGTGGDQVLDVPPDFGAEGEVTFGLTATIVRIDPDTGDVTTEAENLPSVADNGQPLGVIADVEFNGSSLFFLLTGSANELGVEDWPNGVYRVTNNGTDASLVADISTFNDENPVDFDDAFPGGNPFALERRGSGFVVSDGNWNRLLSIASNGSIDILSEFENVVPTGLANGPSGAVLNTWFSPAPHLPGESHVVSVASPSGAVTELASGPASMIDVSIGPDGNTYVLQFSDFVEDESAPPSPTGRIYQLEGSTLTLLVDGLVLPTSLNFSGDTAYVTTLIGDVWQIEDFSSIDPLPAPSPTPPAPAPTTPPGPAPTPGGVVSPPDTGHGAASGDGASAWVLPVMALLALGGALAFGGAQFARRGR